MKNWNNQQERDEAFELVLTAARDDADFAAELLEETTAKAAFERKGEIQGTPSGLHMVFYRQEDRKNRLVMQIPAKEVSATVQKPATPTFPGCFLCTYITYIENRTELNQLYEVYKLRDLK